MSLRIFYTNIVWRGNSPGQVCKRKVAASLVSRSNASQLLEDLCWLSTTLVDMDGKPSVAALQRVLKDDPCFTLLGDNSVSLKVAQLQNLAKNRLMHWVDLVFSADNSPANFLKNCLAKYIIAEQDAYIDDSINNMFTLGMDIAESMLDAFWTNDPHPWRGTVSPAYDSVEALFQGDTLWTVHRGKSIKLNISALVQRGDRLQAIHEGLGALNTGRPDTAQDRGTAGVPAIFNAFPADGPPRSALNPPPAVTSALPGPNKIAMLTRATVSLPPPPLSASPPLPPALPSAALFAAAANLSAGSPETPVAAAGGDSTTAAAFGPHSILGMQMQMTQFAHAPEGQTPPDHGQHHLDRIIVPGTGWGKSFSLGMQWPIHGPAGPFPTAGGSNIPFQNSITTADSTVPVAEAVASRHLGAYPSENENEEESGDGGPYGWAALRQESRRALDASDSGQQGLDPEMFMGLDPLEAAVEEVAEHVALEALVDGDGHASSGGWRPPGSGLAARGWELFPSSSGGGAHGGPPGRRGDGEEDAAGGVMVVPAEGDAASRHGTGGGGLSGGGGNLSLLDELYMAFTPGSAGGASGPGEPRDPAGNPRGGHEGWTGLWSGAGGGGGATHGSGGGGGAAEGPSQYHPGTVEGPHGPSSQFASTPSGASAAGERVGADVTARGGAVAPAGPGGSGIRTGGAMEGQLPASLSMELELPPFTEHRAGHIAGGNGTTLGQMPALPSSARPTELGGGGGGDGSSALRGSPLLAQHYHQQPPPQQQQQSLWRDASLLTAASPQRVGGGLQPGGATGGFGASVSGGGHGGAMDRESWQSSAYGAGVVAFIPPPPPASLTRGALALATAGPPAVLPAAAMHGFDVAAVAAAAAGRGLAPGAAGMVPGSGEGGGGSSMSRYFPPYYTAHYQPQGQQPNSQQQQQQQQPAQPQQQVLQQYGDQGHHPQHPEQQQYPMMVGGTGRRVSSAMSAASDSTAGWLAGYLVTAGRVWSGEAPQDTIRRIAASLLAATGPAGSGGSGPPYSMPLESLLLAVRRQDPVACNKAGNFFMVLERDPKRCLSVEDDTNGSGGELAVLDLPLMLQLAGPTRTLNTSTTSTTTPLPAAAAAAFAPAQRPTGNVPTVNVMGLSVSNALLTHPPSPSGSSVARAPTATGVPDLVAVPAPPTQQQHLQQQYLATYTNISSQHHHQQHLVSHHNAPTASTGLHHHHQPPQPQYSQHSQAQPQQQNPHLHTGSSTAGATAAATPAGSMLQGVRMLQGLQSVSAPMEHQVHHQPPLQQQQPQQLQSSPHVEADGSHAAAATVAAAASGVPSGAAAAALASHNILMLQQQQQQQQQALSQQALSQQHQLLQQQALQQHHVQLLGAVGVGGAAGGMLAQQRAQGGVMHTTATQERAVLLQLLQFQQQQQQQVQMAAQQHAMAAQLQQAQQYQQLQLLLQRQNAAAAAAAVQQQMLQKQHQMHQLQQLQQLALLQQQQQLLQQQHLIPARPPPTAPATHPPPTTLATLLHQYAASGAAAAAAASVAARTMNPLAALAMGSTAGQATAPPTPLTLAALSQGSVSGLSTTHGHAHVAAWLAATQGTNHPPVPGSAGAGGANGSGAGLQLQRDSAAAVLQQHQQQEQQQQEEVVVDQTRQLRDFLARLQQQSEGSSAQQHHVTAQERMGVQVQEVVGTGAGTGGVQTVASEGVGAREDAGVGAMVAEGETDRSTAVQQPDRAEAQEVEWEMEESGKEEVGWGDVHGDGAAVMQHVAASGHERTGVQAVSARTSSSVATADAEGLVATPDAATLSPPPSQPTSHSSSQSDGPLLAVPAIPGGAGAAAATAADLDTTITKIASEEYVSQTAQAPADAHAGTEVGPLAEEEALLSLDHPVQGAGITESDDSDTATPSVGPASEMESATGAHTCSLHEQATTDPIPPSLPIAPSSTLPQPSTKLPQQPHQQPSGSHSAPTSSSSSITFITPEHLLRAFPGLDTRAHALRTLAQVLLHSRHPQLGAATTEPGLLLLVLRQKGLLGGAPDTARLPLLAALLLSEPRFFRIIMTPPSVAAAAAVAGPSSNSGSSRSDGLVSGGVAVQLLLEELLAVVPEAESSAGQGGAGGVPLEDCGGGGWDGDEEIGAEVGAGRGLMTGAQDLCEEEPASVGEVEVRETVASAVGLSVSAQREPADAALQQLAEVAAREEEGRQQQQQPPKLATKDGSKEKDDEEEEEADEAHQLVMLMRLLATGARLEEEPLPDSVSQLRQQLSPLLEETASTAAAAIAAAAVMTAASTATAAGNTTAENADDVQAPLPPSLPLPPSEPLLHDHDPSSASLGQHIEASETQKVSPAEGSSPLHGPPSTPGTQLSAAQRGQATAEPSPLEPVIEHDASCLQGLSPVADSVALLPLPLASSVTVATADSQQRVAHEPLEAEDAIAMAATAETAPVEILTQGLVVEAPLEAGAIATEKDDGDEAEGQEETTDITDDGGSIASTDEAVLGEQQQARVELSGVAATSVPEPQSPTDAGLDTDEFAASIPVAGTPALSVSEDVSGTTTTVMVVTSSVEGEELRKTTKAAATTAAATGSVVSTEAVTSSTMELLCQGDEDEGAAFGADVTVGGSGGPSAVASLDTDGGENGVQEAAATASSSPLGSCLYAQPLPPAPALPSATAHSRCPSSSSSSSSSSSPHQVTPIAAPSEPQSSAQPISLHGTGNLIIPIPPATTGTVAATTPATASHGPSPPGPGFSPTAVHLQPAVMRYVAAVDVDSGVAEEVAVLATMVAHCMAAGRVVVDCAVAETDGDSAAAFSTPPGRAADAAAAAVGAAPGAGAGEEGSVRSNATTDSGWEDIVSSTAGDASSVLRKAEELELEPLEPSAAAHPAHDPDRLVSERQQQQQQPGEVSAVDSASAAPAPLRPVLLTLLAPAVQDWPAALYVLGVAGAAPDSLLTRVAVGLLATGGPVGGVSAGVSDGGAWDAGAVAASHAAPLPGGLDMCGAAGAGVVKVLWNARQVLPALAPVLPPGRHVGPIQDLHALVLLAESAAASGTASTQAGSLYPGAGAVTVEASTALIRDGGTHRITNHQPQQLLPQQHGFPVRQLPQVPSQPQRPWWGMVPLQERLLQLGVAGRDLVSLAALGSDAWAVHPLSCVVEAAAARQLAAVLQVRRALLYGDEGLMDSLLCAVCDKLAGACP